jgi:hypothetical protein
MGFSGDILISGKTTLKVALSKSETSTRIMFLNSFVRNADKIMKNPNLEY